MNDIRNGLVVAARRRPWKPTSYRHHLLISVKQMCCFSFVSRHLSYYFYIILFYDTFVKLNLDIKFVVIFNSATILVPALSN